MCGRLEGKIALITGASMGMGESHARLFVKEGAKVILADIQDEKGQAVATELGENAAYVHLDISKEEDWANAVKFAEKTFGIVTVVVNNAAIDVMTPIDDLKISDFRRMIDINQLSIFYSYKACIPPMQKNGQGGSFVNISSIEGLRGSDNQMAYSSTKYALRGMTRVAAREYAGDNIRFNSVHPGVIETPIFEQLLKDMPGALDAAIQTIPLKRMANPVEVSHVVAFLASDESSYVTAAEIIVDGGLTA